jgi:hypothetical protein
VSLLSIGEQGVDGILEGELQGISSRKREIYDWIVEIAA